MKFVDDVEECRNEVGFIKTFYPDIGNAVKVVTLLTYPQGCFVFPRSTKYPSRFYGIYFNQHKSGKIHEAVRQLCIKSGKLAKTGLLNYSTCN